MALTSHCHTLVPPANRQPLRSDIMRYSFPVSVTATVSVKPVSELKV